MLRLLIIGLLAYVLYRVIRWLILPALPFGKEDRTGTIDQMVQDPSCQTYIPMRQAIRKVIGGEEYYFCSKSCIEKFEKEIKTGGR